ncbi:hypothetical protein HHI36_001379, partial [Cryptolaemus montrouzieri]
MIVHSSYRKRYKHEGVLIAVSHKIKAAPEEALKNNHESDNETEQMYINGHTWFIGSDYGGCRQ